MRGCLLIVVAVALYSKNEVNSDIGQPRISVSRTLKTKNKNGKQNSAAVHKTRIDIVVIKRNHIVQCCGKLKCTVGKKKNDTVQSSLGRKLPYPTQQALGLTKPSKDDPQSGGDISGITTQSGQDQIAPGASGEEKPGADAGSSSGVNPGGDAGANPGGDAGANPGGDAGANPGGDVSVSPGGNSGVNPGGDPGVDGATNGTSGTAASGAANQPPQGNSSGPANGSLSNSAASDSLSNASSANFGSTSNASTASYYNTTNVTPNGTITTTTTMKPVYLCSQPDCSSYNAALKFPEVTSTTGTAVAGVKGTYKRECSRFYFVSDAQVDVVTAHKNCMIRKMNLVVTGNTSDFTCLKNVASKASPAGSVLWTGGSNEGEFCHKHHKMRWCPDANVHLTNDSATMEGNPAHWNGNPITVPDSGRCTAFKSDAAKPGLLQDSCSTANKYVCEPPCSTITCPTENAKNASLFDASDKLINSKKYGRWIVACGRQYLFGKKPVTWKDNIKICLSLGMKPIVFETAAEQTCVGTAAANWKGNSNYWTGGTSQGCSGYWSWCGYEAPTPPALADDLKWDTGQPDNRWAIEDCLHLRFMPNKSEVLLTDRNCSYKYIYACESKPMQVDNNDCINTCPIEPCARKATLFNSDDELIDFKKYGNWYSACGRNIMLSKEKATWAEARTMCCDIGMTLASIESSEKNWCYSKLIKMLKLNATDYWTSGTDSGCPGQYFWCSRETVFLNSSITWLPGHPNSAAGDCIFASLNITANVTRMATANCLDKKNFMCDVRRKGTTGRALTVECMEIWDVTESDVEALLLAANGTNYSTRLKCFMKCLGEGNNIFLAGQLLADETLKKLESSYQEVPEELEKSFTAYVDCSSISEPDECSTAAATYDCGKDRIPIITQELVDAGKGNATVVGARNLIVPPNYSGYKKFQYKPPVHCIPERKCVVKNYTCAENATIKAQLLLDDMTSVGRRYSLKATNRTVFFSFYSQWTFAFAYKYCCALGMGLLELTNYAEMKELAYKVGAFDNYDDALISDVELQDDNSELWCGSKQPVDKTVYYSMSDSGSQIIRAMPEPSCLREIFTMDMVPYPKLRLEEYSNSTSYPGFFGCGAIKPLVP